MFKQLELYYCHLRFNLNDIKIITHQDCIEHQVRTVFEVEMMMYVLNLTTNKVEVRLYNKPQDYSFQYYSVEEFDEIIKLKDNMELNLQRINWLIEINNKYIKYNE